MLPSPVPAAVPALAVAPAFAAPFASAGPPLVSVVIVSYNTRELTLRCLRELKGHLAAEALSHEIWVVDNASKDNSAAAIESEFPDVKLIASEANLGFGPANNLAFERARGQFLLLLNTDAFLHEGALARLVEFLCDPNNERAGAVGPQLRNADGTLQVSCWKFPSPARSWMESLGIARVLGAHPRWGDYYRWAHDQTRRVDFVIGACLLVRREVYQEVGGFDPEFFLYAEESDWQRRMHAAGWEVAFLPDARATHLGGASGAAEKARVSALFWQGQERYILKHFGRAGWGVMRAGAATGVALRSVAYLVLALSPRKRKRYQPQLRAGLEHLGRLLVSPPPQSRNKEQGARNKAGA